MSRQTILRQLLIKQKSIVRSLSINTKYFLLVIKYLYTNQCFSTLKEMQKGKLKPFLSLPYIHVNYSFIAGCLYPRPSLSDIPLRASRNAITDQASSIVDSFYKFNQLLFRLIKQGKGYNDNHCVQSSLYVLNNRPRIIQGAPSEIRAPDSNFEDPRSIPSSRQHLCYGTLPAPWLLVWNPPEAVGPTCVTITIGRSTCLKQGEL